MRWIAAIVVLALMTSCSIEKAYQMRQKHKVNAFEQVDLKRMIGIYMNKQAETGPSIEGIYSVSSVVIKKRKGFLSDQEKEKVKDRQDNYARVALIRDVDNATREYMEVSLNKDYFPSFSVVGEFSGFSEDNILVYTHFEPRGKSSAYTFVYDREKQMLEGVRTVNNGSTQYTYKLTYVKLLPKPKEDNPF